MQFLRDKFSKLKDYSKSVLGNHNKISNSPKDLLEHLLKVESEKDHKEIYLELAEVSRGVQSNTEIADFIVARLDIFKYEAVSIKQTEKLLTAAIFLIKNGGNGFAIDLKNNFDLLEKLGQLDSTHFQGKFSKKGKQLDYQLEVIKHRAKYINLLLTDQPTLRAARERSAQERETSQAREVSEDVAQTSIGLKITSNKSSIAESRSLDKEEVETTYQYMVGRKV